MVLLGIVSSASAATQDTWGPNWYTPYKGYTKPHWDYLTVSKIAWSQSSIDKYDWSDSWEWEFRTKNGNSPDHFWYGPESFYSNLPDAYYEYEHTISSDANDMAIASHSVQNAVANKEYYGTLYLDNKAIIPIDLVIESEVGTDFGSTTSDSVPYRYEVFKWTANVGKEYTW